MLRPDVLRGKKNFSLIYKHGKSLGDKYVVVFYKKNRLGYNRIAFLASKKVGKSVQRNRARRWMKESFRNIKTNLISGFDIIMIARNTINDASYQKVLRSLENALRRAKLLKGEK